MGDVARYSADDYAGAAFALMPPGLAFSPESQNLKALVDVFAAQFARLDASAQQLLSDLFPATTVSFISDWESSLGLTGQFNGTVLTQEQRIKLIVLRLAGNGVYRALDMLALGAIFGYDIGLIDYRVAQAGILSAGDSIFGDAWAAVLGVVSTQTTYVVATCDTFCAGEPLVTWGNSPLEVELLPATPGHIVLRFIYVPGIPIVTDDGFCFTDANDEPITA